MLGVTGFFRRSFPFFVLAGIATVGAMAEQARHSQASKDWPQFGSDVAGSSAYPGSTGITAANIASLKRLQVNLDGTVDASVIYLNGVTVKGSKHDAFFVTTTYGKTIAVDANQGDVLWEYTPSKYGTWAGTRQITNSTPVADHDRQHIYAAAPDGAIRKLAISDGHALWTTPITLLAKREKITSPLKEFRDHIIAITGGYVGDQPPYQGHVAIIDAQSGKLLHVWNSLCSDRAGLIEPSSCSTAQSAIWGRSGAAIDAATGNIFVATGNGPYDGKTNWGDAVIELSSDARMIGNYTPTNNAELNDRDLDIGSTSPALLGGDNLAQGGKDGKIRLLSIKAMAGTAPHQDDELQTVSTPSGADLFTALAVWRHSGETWMFAADKGGAAAWTLKDGKLVEIWKNSNGGTSPVVAGGLLYIYDPDGGKLRVYDPTNGKQVAELEGGRGHWNSPIVVDGKIALPEGNANKHASAGVLDIWSLPAGH